MSTAKIPSPEEVLAGAVFLFDKPSTWTSFDVVNKTRYLLSKYTEKKRIKLGHAGTLDPLATGLLILCAGKATKTIDRYQGMRKTYTGIIRVGGETASYDAETEVHAEYPIEHISHELIEEARQSFLGLIEQVPPIYSAIKVNGKRAYKMARKGEEVTMKTRQIEIYDFVIEKVALPHIHFTIECSKGTYIRSIAYDFGKKLQSGAYLFQLRREAIGDFNVKNAWEIDDFVDKVSSLIKE